MFRKRCNVNYVICVTIIMTHESSVDMLVLYNVLFRSILRSHLFLFLIYIRNYGIIELTHFGRGIMKRPHPPESKLQALRHHNALNTRATQVTDEQFQTLEFFDPRDLIQVKYEMVRRVHKDGWSVTRAAEAFGFSRISYYRIHSALQTQGLMGLMPGKRGPQHATKITEAVDAFIHKRLDENPGLSCGKLKDLVAEELGVQVHRRTIERAVRRKKKRRAARRDASEQGA
jgi:transposase